MLPKALEPKITDEVWFTTVDVGDPGCLCSRCREPITQGIPIYLFPESGRWCFRYHPECLGFSDPFEDVESDDADGT